MVKRLVDSIFMYQLWRLEFPMLNLIALILLAMVVMAWGRHDRRRPLLLSGCISVLVVALVYLTTVRASDIPIEWITILHEGLEYATIRQLYAQGAHAGPNFAFVLSAIAAGASPNLHDVVWLNLLLALVNAAIFFHIALDITGIAWALAWTAVFALNPATFLASFSELPTNLLGLYLLSGIIGWAVLTDALPQPRVIRGAAYALCAMLTVLVASTRVEVALIGVVAVTLHAGYAVLGADRWAAAERRLREACGLPLAFFSNHPAAVVVLSLAGWWLAQAGLPWGLVGRPESAGLYPFNASILSLYVYLPMLMLPAGVSLGVLLGTIYAIVHFRRFGGLVLSLLVIVRAYFAAQNQYYEAGRYLSYILPAIFVLGLFGNEQLRELARRWRPNWCHAARIVYLMAWFTHFPPGVPDFYLRPEYHRDAGFSQVLLDLNTQREARYLLALTEENPQCVFVGRVVEGHDNPMAMTRYDYAVFGEPIAQPIFVPEKEMPLADVIERYASGASCVRLYYGGDCNLTFTDRCKTFVTGRHRIEEKRFWSRPYNSLHDFGYSVPEITLATYAWP